MEISQARAFLAVAEELHFGRAAERLNTGQSPLSRAIQKLERQLGAQLFERTSRQVRLTDAGEALVEPARELLAAAERAVEAVETTVSGQAGHVTLGFAGASSNTEVAALLRRLSTVAPRLRCTVHSSQFADDSLNKVLAGELDFGVGLWEYVPGELDSLHIAYDEAIIALPASHRLARVNTKRTIKIAELAEEPWINLPGGYNSALQNRFRQLCSTAGFVPKRNEVVPDSWTVMLLVGLGMGASLSLASVASKVPAGDVSFFTIDGFNPPLPLRLVWRRDAVNAILATVIDTARDLFS